MDARIRSGHDEGGLVCRVKLGMTAEVWLDAFGPAMTRKEALERHSPLDVSGKISARLFKFL
jgi:hypothetical protein